MASSSKVSQFLPRLVTRNPRNLEMLRVAPIGSGYQFEADRCRKNYYYKVDLVLSRVGRHSTAQLLHHDAPSRPVLTASTREWAIARRLYSCVDQAATYNLGRILARRCLQAGIHSALRGCSAEQLEISDKLKQFYRGLEEEGLSVEEQAESLPNDAHPHLQPFAKPGRCYDDQLEYEPARIQKNPLRPIKGKAALGWKYEYITR